ncbi:hypothetical protein F503_05275 [Ophiostoma piceae UAMH 11346]|uniref:Uncharacterized protein n=1 Tax=Ophiostoma piceae (strain UAMH 11346) TaxID=1262450 RepID=S3D9J5_OPHP1|nr:hypothetical protein F503_05275 [Ophiostoma piceae UAMH 11346]
MESISYTESPSLLPIYRNGNSDILPARAQREAAAAEQPWTATRCHRQLRPLLAHITALRRERAIAELKKKNDDSRYLPNPKKRLLGNNIPADRKRVRYTYSLKGTGRRRNGEPSTIPLALDTPDRPAKAERSKYVPAKQQAKRSFSPGEIVLATPMISRARKTQHTQCLPSSPLAYTAESTSAADAQSRETSSSKIKVDNPIPGHGYYRRLPRLGSNNAAKTPADEEWAILSKEMPIECQTLYESVFRTVGCILRATTDTQGTTGKPNSLLSMCLRKVPLFISMCEDAERKESEEKQAGTSSVSLDIYNDLESMGRAGRGWNHLRTVVREHAFNILKESCAEGLFHFAFIRLLVRLCVSTKAYSQAEALMSVLFDVHKLAAPRGQHLFQQPTDVNSGIPDSAGAFSSLSLLIQYSHETGRASAPLRLITSLLESGHLPPAWLSTRAFTNVWHRVARLLSSRGTTACDEAVLLDFMVSALSSLLKSRPEDDIHSQTPQASPRNCESATPLSSSSSYHALVSILGTMCAISIIQREALLGGHSTGTVHEPAVAKRLANTIHCCLAEIDSNPRRQKGLPRRYLLELALCVLGFGACRDEDDAGPIDDTRFRRFGQVDDVVQGQLYDVTVAFATSVAENCGRGSKPSISSVPDVRDYLRNICLHFSKRLGGVVNCESAEDMSGHLLADSAFLLASRSSDLRDLAFAESLGKSMTQKASLNCLSAPRARCTSMFAVTPQTLETPLPRAQTGPATLPGLFEGYRWEEGISEWVISTPISVEAVAVASMKPDLLRTPRPYLTPSPSMRESSYIKDMFEDDEDDNDGLSGESKDSYNSDDSDAGDSGVNNHDTPSPELPSRRVSVARPRRTAGQSLPSSDFCPYSSDPDLISKTRKRPGNVRPKRASLPARRKSQSVRPRRSLGILDLVSDDLVDDDFEESFRACDSSSTIARTPLLSLAGNVRQSVGTGHLGQLGRLKHKGTSISSSSSSTAQMVAISPSSDDELGL